MYDKHFKLFFTIGQSVNSSINEKIIEEFRINHDILQINNFTDSYFQMTSKIFRNKLKPYL